MRWYIDEILPKYDITFDSAEPYRDGFMLTCGHQKYILKHVTLEENRIRGISECKEYLYRQGFHGEERYIPTAEGTLLCEVDDNRFVLTEAIKGRDCDFDNMQDVKVAARALAEFHRASRGFIPAESVTFRKDLYKLPDTYRKRLAGLSKMRKLAEKGRDEFDKCYMKNVDYYIRQGNNALSVLESSAYNRLCAKAEREGQVSHNDFTHYNVRISDHGNGIIMNMENMGIDILEYDLVNFIRRKMRKCDWNIDVCGEMLAEYGRICPLTPEELKVTAAILEFPQKFWRTANAYYNSKRGWVEKSHLKKMEETLAERELHREFTDNFYKKFA
ncbi:MAG: CotS family spore coat protein [Clostridia bacterium]|nr:CotS family spore coat protein [Clostridia bacterium]